MRTLRSRTNILFILVILTGVTFAMLTADSYRKISNYHEIINRKFQLRQMVSHTNVQQFSKVRWQELRNYRDRIANKKRRSALTQVIAAYGSKNPYLLTRRVEQFELLEREAYNKTMELIQYEHHRLRKNAILTFALPLLGLILLIAILRTSFFNPIRKLSQRMMDFLADKYSFKFAIPDDNEIGDLQRTFNSLAQRVLNNMDELKDLDRAKSEFLSIASHELRTPMTSIKGSLSLLKSGVMGELDESSLRLIRIAENESDRLIRLINELLDLAKIESRSLSLNKKWINLDQMLKKSLEGLLGLAQAAEVNLRLQTFKKPVEILADEDRLQQVITNLVSNAIKFSPKGTEVTVHVHLSPKKDLIVEVIDQGPGIAKDDQDLIFEKFRQTNGTQESQLVKGTGLGLAIAKALISEHGGDIGVHSTLGQGSTFYFSLKDWRKVSTSHFQEEANSDSRLAA